MNLKLAVSMAKKNLAANRLIVLPFILSSGIMTMITYIITSLMNNEYVQRRNPTFIQLIVFGAVLSMMITAIFFLYSNNYVIKRRKKEFALYGILGLEKSHIRRIIFVEQLLMFLAIAAIGLISGHIVGKLTFLGMGKLFHMEGFSVAHYPLAGNTIIRLLIFLTVLFLILFLFNVVRISIQSPKQLLDGQKSGESEPKTKLFLGIIGVGILGFAYFRALTIEGTLNSLGHFFILAILVVIGMYAVFASVTVIVLKLMKGRKNYYYKADHFISVSGMLHRIKSHAIGLSSIAVLCTCLILTVSITGTIYGSIHHLVKSSVPMEYSTQAQIPSAEKEGNLEKSRNEVYQKFLDLNKNKGTFAQKSTMFFISGAMQEDRLTTGKKSDLGGTILFFTVASEYNNYLKIPKNTVYIFSNQNKKIVSQTSFAGKKYQIHAIQDSAAESGLYRYAKQQVAAYSAANVYLIVFSDYSELQHFYNYYRTNQSKSENIRITSTPAMSFDWELKGESASYYKELKAALKKEKKVFFVETANISERTQDVYGLNGGFMFIGIAVGLLFLIGAVLIIYYKQISEGYEDRTQFQIMKKVGLPDSLIRKTSANQILWLFGLPVIATTANVAVSSKIIYQLLQLFGINQWKEYLIPLFVCSGIFLLFYLIIFGITSRAYYKQVN